jgi:hypothetical protein
VDVNTSLPFKFKQHAHSSIVACSAAQHPSTTAENRTRKRLDESRRLSS